jgi:hypothetical protein
MPHKRLLLFLFCTLAWVPVNIAGVSTDSVAVTYVKVWDEGNINYRHPPYRQIEEWQSDSKYRYDRDDSGPGFWNYLLSRILYWLLSATSGRPWFFYVLLVLGGFLMLFLLLRLLNVPVTGLFVISQHRENSGLQFNDNEFDYSSDKLRDMLAMYRNNGAYREAVRVMFLLYLRELHSRQIITIRHFKTNYDYYKEIQTDSEKQSEFRQLMRLFDVVWYGHVDLTMLQFNEIEKAFGIAKEGRGRL